MFKVKINEKEYVVCSEGEFNFLGNMTSPVFTIPNYLDLDYKVGTQTVIKITNNVPIIIDESNLTNQDEFNRSINVNFEEKPCKTKRGCNGFIFDYLWLWKSLD